MQSIVSEEELTDYPPFSNSLANGINADLSTANYYFGNLFDLDDLHTGLDALGLFFDPADWVNSGIYALEGNYKYASLGMASSVPFLGWAATAGKYSEKAGKFLTGQIHHGISRTIGKAIAKHPTLAGHFVSRDPRFVTQAKDLWSHFGYQKWHRDLDKEVVDHIQRHLDMTPDDFIMYLKDRYSMSDLLNRFPDGL